MLADDFLPQIAFYNFSDRDSKLFLKKIAAVAAYHKLVGKWQRLRRKFTVHFIYMLVIRIQK